MPSLFRAKIHEAERLQDPSDKKRIKNLSHLLADAGALTQRIKDLAAEGCSHQNPEHKQFYLSQILKLVDEPTWKSLEDKGTPP